MSLSFEQMYTLTIYVFIIGFSMIDGSKIIDTQTMMERQGRDVILPCRFEQFNDKDRIMWLKDGLVLSVNQDISGDRRKYEILNQYDLIVKNTINDDSGQYICQNFDQMLSRNVLLTILTQPTKPDIQQINESLRENSSGKFLCITYGGNPPPRFTWLINQMKINQSFYENLLNNNRSLSELNLPIEKRFHNTSLICQIENEALDRPLITFHSLNIQYKPQVNLYHDRMMITNLNLLVMENDYLNIECRIDANPSLNRPITWLKNSASIPGVTSTSLIIQNVKRNDDGEYICMSSNAIGHSQSSVHIRVQYSPIVEINGGGFINENQRLILICQVDSYPSIDYYQWYRNHEKLNISSLASSLVIEKITKDDAGIYICMVKNTLKYANGTTIEKFNKTQTRVIVQYPPKVSTSYPIIAEDLSASNIIFSCEIDSNPEPIIHWKFNNKILFNSPKYTITRNQSMSYLILQQIQSTFDYGYYSCNASNKLGYNSTHIQLRSKVVPESPINLNVTYVSYSTISVKWQAGFHGGWKQVFRVTLDESLSKETNQTQFTFTNLRHLEYYNITVRAYNQLGPSATSAFIRVKTNDVPIIRSNLPLIESALFILEDNSLHYRLDNITFQSMKIPLCIRMEIFNETNVCQRIVTSSGILNLNENYWKDIHNLSVCLDQYEEFCGESVVIQIKRHNSFNWIFIVVSAILIVILLILLGLCIFCVILKYRRRRGVIRARENLVPNTLNKKSSHQPVILEPIISRTANGTNLFTNVTYPEQQQAPSSYKKLNDTDKFEPFFTQKLSMNSTDLITSNLHSSSLTVPDLSNDHSKNFSIQDNDINESHCQYIGYSYLKKDDPIESGYSTPMKTCSLNKKTVYEVVV